jgi:hypothetical protein
MKPGLYILSFCVRRCKVALEWTIKYYAILIFSMLALAITLFVLILAIDKLKVMNKLNE